jgi:hypothetical protein
MHRSYVQKSLPLPNGKCTEYAAQPAHAVDAAARPRDPSFFEGQNRLESCTDLLMAAQLMGIPLGRFLPSPEQA